MSDCIRIDKWLWTVRIFKTRSQATEVCKLGKVKVDNQIAKASRDVRIGDEISINFSKFVKTVKVGGILKSRVSAKIAAQNMEDLTPDEEYKKLETINAMNFEYRDRGTGRPTKKERRDINQLKNNKS